MEKYTLRHWKFALFNGRILPLNVISGGTAFACLVAAIIAPQLILLWAVVGLTCFTLFVYAVVRGLGLYQGDVDDALFAMSSRWVRNGRSEDEVLHRKNLVDELGPRAAMESTGMAVNVDGIAMAAGAPVDQFGNIYGVTSPDRYTFDAASDMTLTPELEYARPYGLDPLSGEIQEIAHESTHAPGHGSGAYS